MKLNKLSVVFLTFCLSLQLTGCGSDKDTANTKKYIQEIKAQAKPNTNDDKFSLGEITKTPKNLLKKTKARNPFTLAVTSSVNSTTTNTRIKLVGIFHLGVGSNEKKWAILHMNNKTHKVIAGEKIGNNLISKISKNTVTIIRTENGEEESFVLKLQEQKQ